MKRGARNFGRFAAEPRNDLIRNLLCVPRAAAARTGVKCSCRATTGKGGDGVHGRIFHHDFIELFELFGHGVKEYPVALNVAVDAAGILLGKSPGDCVVEIAGKNDGTDGDQKYDKLIAKDDAEAAIVYVNQPFENTFRKTISAAMPAPIDTQKMSAEHGSCGERHKQRNADGDAQCHSELAEKAADDAGEHEDGNKNGDQRSAHGKNSEADFLGAEHGCGNGFMPPSMWPGNVFDDDDRVVHHENRWRW
jgi:hypothetical protein